MPFDLTNRVGCFQRVTDEFIHENNLMDTFMYLYDVTFCGKTKEEHDFNMQGFLEITKMFNLALNHDKCVFSVTSINQMGYCISNGEIKPNPAHLLPLRDLPVSHDLKSLSSGDKDVLTLFPVD